MDKDYKGLKSLAPKGLPRVIPSISEGVSPRGFTLVELLVVIAVIGILATVIIVNLTLARVRARDSRRMADITSIKGALELYKDINGRYPAGDGGSASDALSTPLQQFLPNFPEDPLAPDRRYQYISPTGAEYGIYINFEQRSYDNPSYWVDVCKWGETTHKCKTGVNVLYNPNGCSGDWWHVPVCDF
jgi:type II secretion system protein G